MSAGAIFATIAGQAAETGINFWENRNKDWREDNAITRRVADMKRSGLNPILAAGNPSQASGAGSQSIDTNMASDLIAGAALQKIKLENKNLDVQNDISSQELNNVKQEYKNQIQEYNERARNIEYYKRNSLPSDNPDSLINKITQGKEVISDILDSPMWGAAADQAKAAGSKLIHETIPSKIDEAKKKLDNWFKEQRRLHSNAGKSQAEYYKTYRGIK